MLTNLTSARVVGGLAVCLLAASAAAGAPAIPESVSGAEGVVPRGWKLLASAAGDLNRDGKPDLAVALSQVEPALVAHEDDRPRILALYLRGKEGRLRRSATSQAVLLRANQGGVWGDPFESLAIERGAVVIRHYGGSAHRWGYVHRFRLQEAEWKLIGETRVSHHTLSHFRRERDHNLVTGLVLVTEHPEEEKAPETRQAYHELRAGPAAKAPVLDGRLSKGEWPGLTLRLVDRKDVVGGQASWSGPADLSAVLGAVTHGGSLHLRAEVTDDRVLAGDAVRLVDDRGNVIVPESARRLAGDKGYVWEARYELTDLPRAGGEDPALRLSVEVVDVDAAGAKEPTVLSASRGGRRFPAAIRVVPETGLPTLSRFSFDY